jgi:hypothetical protein
MALLFWEFANDDRNTNQKKSLPALMSFKRKTTDLKN